MGPGPGPGSHQPPMHGRMPPQAAGGNGNPSLNRQGPPGYMGSSSNGNGNGNDVKNINGNWQSNKDMEHRRDMIQNM